MQRRQFLKTLSASAAALSLSPLFRCTSEKRPNVLLILTDDQGWGDISSHNNPTLSTPNMDRIAAEGARLDRFYVSPVCAPTRASLLTGRYHLRSGVNGVTRGLETMRSEEVTLAEILKQNGYATGAFGKWHNGAHYPYHPNGQGFDEFIGFCAGHWNNYFDTPLEHNGQEITSIGYMVDYLTDMAIQFIEANRNQPFFCYVPYNTPHSPFQVPDAYFNKYKEKGLDDTLACVYGMCENLDDNIGRLLHTLNAMNIADNTIVIFITDNGPNTDRYNGNMRGRKGSPHEGGSRVPCFIRWPNGITAGTTIPHISAHIDMLPTLVELLNVPSPETLPLDGISLAPLLTDPNTDWPDRPIFGHWGRSGSVRTPQYRLVVKPSGTELYDMIADPDESNNIAKQQVAVLNRLKSEYEKWYAEVTKNGFDPIPIPIGYDEMPEVILPGHEALLYPEIGSGISYNGPNGWANDWITNWTRNSSYAYWPIEVVEEGDYEISLDYICDKQHVGVEFVVEIGEKQLQGEIIEAHNPPHLPSPDRVERKEVYEKVWRPLTVGTMHLTPGTSELRLLALRIPGQQAMDVKAVRVKKL